MQCIPSEALDAFMLMPKWGGQDKDFWAICNSARRLLCNSNIRSCSSRRSLVKYRGLLQLLGLEAISASMSA